MTLGWAGLAAVLATTPVSAETPAGWLETKARSAIGLCAQPVLDPVLAARNAEAAGWPEFRQGSAGGVPGFFSAQRERPKDRKSQHVVLGFQRVGSKGVRSLYCLVQASPGVTDLLRDELKARFGGDGQGGWWIKQTADGLQPLSLGEMVAGVDGFEDLLEKMPAGSRIVFATVEDTRNGSLTMVVTSEKSP